MVDRLVITGAREHNLKNVTVEMPRDKLIVITGLSGSGKSSLAFDTIYAEGQRRYVESLSAYARQFLEQMDKPDVDSIEGPSPAISIEQKTTSRKPRGRARRRWARWIDRQPEVRQDLLDHISLLDRGQQTQPPAAVGASENVDRKNSAQQLGPREMARPHVGGRLRSGLACGTRSFLDDDQVAVGRPTRGESAVVNEQVDARARNDGSELFQKLRPFEANRLRPVAPWPPEAQQNFAVRGQLQCVLGNGRTQYVTAQMFESLVLPVSYRSVGVQVETLDVGVARPTRNHQRRRGVTAQARHPLTGTQSRGHPSKYGPALHLHQHRRLERQRVAAAIVETALQVDVVAPQEADDPARSAQPAVRSG
jgi:hypothetical protein